MPEQPKGFVIQPPQPIWGTPEDRDLHIVLVTPEIPGNTGNVGRLCAGTNIWLHLIEPLGFELSNKYLRRAGLDYWPHVKVCTHASWEEVERIFGEEKLHLFTKKTTHIFSDAAYTPGDVLVFGCETKGLPEPLLERMSSRARLIPKTDKVRSLNMSNAVAIAAYEAMRQLDWEPMNRDV